MDCNQKRNGRKGIGGKLEERFALWFGGGSLEMVIKMAIKSGIYIYLLYLLMNFKVAGANYRKRILCIV